jgi:hypothetical protein
MDAICSVDADEMAERTRIGPKIAVQDRSSKLNL